MAIKCRLRERGAKKVRVRNLGVSYRNYLLNKKKLAEKKLAGMLLFLLQNSLLYTY